MASGAAPASGSLRRGLMSTPMVEAAVPEMSLRNRLKIPVT